MKRLFLMAGVLMALTAGAQEQCRWDDVNMRFYRMAGVTNCAIENVSRDGKFMFTNSAAAIFKTGVVEAAFTLLGSNWVSQEHMRFVVLMSENEVVVSDPTRLSRTGQTNSYRPGDDGDLEPGCGWPDRFSVQADTNLVVDHLTGLMWARNAGISHGNWDVSVDTCYHATFIGGYEDWRLPSVREMESLIDLGRAVPALPFGHPFNNLQANYWTGTSDVEDPGRAWVVSLLDGQVARWVRTNTAPYAWPVRDYTSGKSPVPRTGQTNSLRIGDDGHLQPGRAWPVPRFTILSDTNLVFDNLCGRMWTRQVGAGFDTNWAAAVDYCAALEFGGYDDWRLPSRREVWSLIDFGNTQFLPAGHPFLGAPSNFFWSSSTHRLLTNNAWRIERGYLGPHDKNIAGSLWPVRGNW